jgi:hypothetical protein
MTPAAVLLVFYIKGFFSIVAFSAEIAFIDAGHFHFVRTLGHLEYLVVTAGAFETFFIHMLFMAEDDYRSVLGSKGYVTSPDLFGRSGVRQNEAVQNSEYQCLFHNMILPPVIEHLCNYAQLYIFVVHIITIQRTGYKRFLGPLQADRADGHAVKIWYNESNKFKKREVSPCRKARSRR